MGWDELIEDDSRAHASCAICPHFHARGSGKEGISQVVQAANDHSRLGRDHSIQIEVEL